MLEFIEKNSIENNEIKNDPILKNKKSKKYIKI